MSVSESHIPGYNFITIILVCDISKYLIIFATHISAEVLCERQ